MNPLFRYAACAAALSVCAPARAFLGVGDVSFVTVVANPAEAANWAAELEQLSDQLAAARNTLQTVSDLKTFAGDPRAAVAAAADLSGIDGSVQGLLSGAQTETDLARTWQGFGTSQQLAAAAALLAGSGSGATMRVFGRDEARDPSLYVGLAAASDAETRIRSQVAGEQGTRATVGAALALAWTLFRSAPDETTKQALLTEISQLQSQNQVMDTRRRALLDDLALADRESRGAALVQAKAADEQALAESSLLNQAVEARTLGSESQRLATLQKAPAAPAPHDYSAVQMWTTADAGGPLP